MEVKTVIKRVLMILLVVFTVGIIFLAGLIIWDSVFPSQRVTDFANVTFPGPDGIELFGYLAKPSTTAAGAAPGLLLVHEFFGLNEDIVKKADLLAEQGYVVLAVDAYRGKTTSLVPRAIFLVISTPQEQIQIDLDAAYRFLAEQTEVNSQNLGALGFCFGGTQVMHLATRNPELGATAIFYGSGPITDPSALGVMDENGPVLGIYGAEDAQIPLEEVRGFEEAMNARGVVNTVTVYDGVGHAFVSIESLQESGPARQAWDQMLAFFSENLP